VEDFGAELRRRRETRGWSLRRFAELAGIDFGYLGQIERGERRCSKDWAQICDQTLGANGELLDAYRAEAEGRSDVRRRVMLSAAAGIPAIAFDVLRADHVPMAGAEALRHDLVGALGTDVDVAEWEAIAWSYGCTYGETPPRVLLEDLQVDLLVARTQLGAVADERTKRSLQRVIALLSAFMAQTFGNLGDSRAGFRWWRTARTYADASRDTDARVWVRGREVIRGMYERRPLVPLLDIADEAGAISSTVGMGTCAALAGRAQILAMLGRRDEADAALARVYDTMPKLPASVSSDTASMYGWPEYRLRHTESYVFTYQGDDRRAEAAHDRAMALYAPAMFRERAQVELHRAVRLVRAGDTDGGAAHAQQVLQRLPSDQRIAAVIEIARVVADSTPAAERSRPQVAGLHEMLVLPAGR
jgi:transcriptional regulator with XRE-family HTH domain